MKKLAICGSRDINLSYLTVADLVSKLVTHERVEVVSGGAKGVDASALKFSQEMYLKYTEFPADWKTYGKAAGPIRNKQIAEYADQLLVIRYPDSKGSLNVAAEFRKLGKPVTEIILPNPKNQEG